MQFALTFGSNEFTKFLHVNRRNDPVLSFFSSSWFSSQLIFVTLMSNAMVECSFCQCAVKLCCSLYMRLAVLKKKVQCLERSRVRAGNIFWWRKKLPYSWRFFFLRRCPAQITHRVNNWHEKPLTRSYPFYRVTQMSAVNITYYSNPTSWFPRLATGLIPFSFPSLL